MLKKILIESYKVTAEVLKFFGAGKLSFFRKASQFCYSFLKVGFVEMNGFKIYLDEKDSLCLSVYGVYEPEELSVLDAETKEGSIVIDLGANIGYHTLHISRHVGEKGHVYAFEPDPENFRLLQKNIAVNNITNVTMVDKAVSSKTGKLKLYLSDVNKADHRICETSESRKSVEIEAVTLDGYFAEYSGSIDLIKMDIQGAEYLALDGMVNVLEKNKSIKILMEYWPLAIKECGGDAEVMLDKIISLGFSL